MKPCENQSADILERVSSSLRGIPAVVPEFQRWSRAPGISPAAVFPGRLALGSLFTTPLGADEGVLDINGAECLLAKEVPLENFPEITDAAPWTGGTLHIYRDGVDENGMARYVAALADPIAASAGRPVLVRLVTAEGQRAEAQLSPQWPSLCAEPRLAASLNDLEIELALGEAE